LAGSFDGVIDELAVIGVLFAAVALISCLSVGDKRTIRRMPRALWVLVIVLVPLVGPVAWFAFGRPRKPLTLRSGWRVAVGRPEQPRPPAPDDDPDFLRSLDPPGRGPERRDRRPDPGTDE
jgi:Phospholipase_D-nuclease N-terminal